MMPVTVLPEFLQTPEVCGSVLQVFHLHGHNGLWEGAAVFPLLKGHQVRGQGGVGCVGEQDKLELHLKGQPCLGQQWSAVVSRCM